jgi:hypothetical protein
MIYWMEKPDVSHITETCGKTWHVALNVGGDNPTLIMKKTADNSYWIVSCYKENWLFVTLTNGYGSYSKLTKEQANAILGISNVLLLEEGVYDGGTSTTYFIDPRYEDDARLYYDEIIKKGNPALINIIKY